MNVEFSEYLADACFVVPSVQSLHVVHGVLQALGVLRGVVVLLEQLFVAGDGFHGIAVAGETGFEHGHSRRKFGLLRQKTDA